MFADRDFCDFSQVSATDILQFCAQCDNGTVHKNH